MDRSRENHVQFAPIFGRYGAVTGLVRRMMKKAGNLGRLEARNIVLATLSPRIRTLCAATIVKQRG